MAFMGMAFAAAAIIFFAVLIILALVFITVAVVSKKRGRKKNSRKMEVVGNFFLGLGIACFLPVLLVGGIVVFSALTVKVNLPDEKVAYISRSKVEELEILRDDNFSNTDRLGELLDKTPNLIYYHDINCEGVIDMAACAGNSEAVKISLEHGAIFDDPERYDHMAYATCSVQEFLESLISRKVTEDDIEILNLMFENRAGSEYMYEGGTDSGNLYSNALGQAAFSVLYNDESVTDLELELLHIIENHGITSDPQLILYEDIPSNIFVSCGNDGYVAKDDNYRELLEIVY